MDTDGAAAPGAATDRAWLSRLYRSHADRLNRYLRARIGPAAADDLVNDTFLAAWTGRDQFDPTRGGEVGWLYGIASNLLRRRAREQATHLRAVTRLDADSGVFGGDASDGAAGDVAMRAVDGVVASDAVRRLVPDLLALPDLDRDVLLLVAWGGLTPTEVAVAPELPAGTVRSRLSRARAKLRRVITVLEAPETEQPSPGEPVIAPESTPDEPKNRADHE